MKKLSVSLLALSAALIAAPAAYAADLTPGWYATAGAGLVFPQDPTIYAGGNKYKPNDENNNLDLLVGGGYAFGNGLRLETEYLHNQMNADKLDGARAFGHVTNNYWFFNAYYDVKNSSIFTPYVGAGIGPDFVSVKNYGSSTGNLNGDVVTFGYQGIVGTAIKLSHNWAVTADYRYIGSTDPKVDYTGGTKGRVSDASQNFIIGIRYSFGGEEPVAEPVREVTPPPARPHAAVRPAVAPVEQNFTVFFDFDKSVLTPEAKRIIVAAAEKFKKDGFAKIVVTGHTDTVGTVAYNQKLSERRAAAVKAELEKLGVGGASIKSAGVGKTGLLVPTTDGVREAQNRRAEIVLAK